MHKKLVVGIVIGLVLISLVAAIAVKGDNRVTAKGNSGQKIGVIYIEGTIVSTALGGIGASGVAAADQIVANLKQARENPEIKAVILRLNAGGGSVVGSDEIGREIERLRHSGKKVVAVMGEMAASGGYWVACKADKIVANPGTFTGSIGVIMQVTKLKDLYNKIGVDVENFTTGPHKDMGSTNRDVTPEERQIFQGLVQDSYEDFINVVAKGRKMDPARVRQLADGRVYTGKQAKSLGLVDELGDFTDAVKLTANLAHIKGEPELVEIGDKNNILNSLLARLPIQGKLLPMPLEGLLLMPDQAISQLRSEF